MTAPDTSSLPERENDEVTEEQIERTKQILGNTIHARTGKDFRRSIVEADKLLAERKTTSNSPRLIFQRGTRIGNLKGYLQKVYADDFSLTAEENEEKAARRNPTRRD